MGVVIGVILVVVCSIAFPWYRNATFGLIGDLLNGRSYSGAAKGIPAVVLVILTFCIGLAIGKMFGG